MRFTFEVPGKPVPQGSMRSLGPRRMVHSNQDVLLPWRASVTAAAMSQCPKEWDTAGPISVNARFWFPHPKSHVLRSGLIKPAAPWYVITRPDLDKLVRAVCDGLTDAGIWVDDSQAVQLHADKTYTDTGPGGLWCIVQHLTERNTGA